MSNPSDLIQQSHAREEASRASNIAAALVRYAQLDNAAQEQPTDADARVLADAMKPGGLPTTLRAGLYPGRPWAVDHLTTTDIDLVVANLKRLTAAAASRTELGRVDFDALVRQRREEFRAAKATAAAKMLDLMRPIYVAETLLDYAIRKASDKAEAEREFQRAAESCRAIIPSRPPPEAIAST